MWAVVETAVAAAAVAVAVAVVAVVDAESEAGAAVRQVGPGTLVDVVAGAGVANSRRV